MLNKLKTPLIMKKITLLLWAAALAACTSETAMQVSISNPTPSERDDEMVELSWASILEKLPEATAENIVVYDDEGEEVVSQVIYRGEEAPQALIFAIDVDGGQSELITLKTGVRGVYEPKAFGRQVPERYDDYAWENNLCAYRLYGPALETSPEKLITPGIDVWVKCTEKLVIDEWYAKGDYHHNYGDGMDCYKVGRTLGGGASVPMVDGKFWPMEHNYATARTLDNGPLRTSVELTYVGWDVNGVEVSLVKTITLDADDRFNKMENV